MKTIPIKEALASIFSSEDAIIMCGDDFQTTVALKPDADSASTAYETDGCIVLETKVPWAAFPYYQICPASPEPDYLEAWEHFKIKEPSMVVLGEITPEIRALGGKLIKIRYGRTGERFVTNPRDCIVDGMHIRELTSDDIPALCAFCDVNEDESPFAAGIYKNIRCCIDAGEIEKPRGNIVHLGAWVSEAGENGEIVQKLIGEAAIMLSETADIYPVACIWDIVVAQSYRRRGVGRALVKAALSLYPDHLYAYDVDEGNFRSSATAISAGFSLKGAFI